MASRRIIWQLYPSYLIITVIAVVVMGWYGLASQKQDYLVNIERDLEDRAYIIQDQIASYILDGDFDAIQTFCNYAGINSITRITVIDTSGIVLGDTDENPDDMENHGSRPEILTAFRNGVGVSTRFSNTLQKNLMYVAVRIENDGRLIGIIRTALPVTFVDESISAARGRMVMVGFFVAFLAALICYVVSRKISRPLEDLKEGATKFAQGDLDRHLPVSRTEEIGGLATAMNEMARQLNERIRLITRQRGEQEAVLASMAEGVLAFDINEKLISINKAAADFLDIDPIDSLGLTIHEAVRNSSLQKVIAETLWTKKPVRSTIEFSDRGERWAQASATILRDAKDVDLGVLVVLNDITRLRKLENLRQDFVANVSHELKTPITSIMGSVETLMDGAIKSPEDTDKFLSIISKQSDRMHHLIEDLLHLSRIETESEQGDIVLESQLLKPVLLSAISNCEPIAVSKKVEIKLDCPDNLKARINGPLFEQAIINLIDNAVKYGADGGVVEIKAIGDEVSIQILIIDKGRGIEKKHLSRIFERFYRIDKGRSRELGGTGLGLAIVKHIILAHRGRIMLESSPGQGCTFKIDLPTI